jgi:hypothetical protein
MAMAFAEARRFDEAFAIQERILASLGSPPHPDAKESLSANQERYEQRQSCPEPWPSWDRFPLNVTTWRPFANPTD